MLFLMLREPQFSVLFFPPLCFCNPDDPLFFLSPLPPVFILTSRSALIHCLSFLLNNFLFLDASGQQQPSSVGAQPHSGASDPGPIRATAPMWRCSRIMHMQRELHPTLLSSLEGIVDQMVWFRENWHEEVRRAKVLVLCVSDFVATCVFSGSDGEKIIQLVVKIHVSLYMCENKLEVTAIA